MPSQNGLPTILPHTPPGWGPVTRAKLPPQSSCQANRPSFYAQMQLRSHFRPRVIPAAGPAVQRNLQPMGGHTAWVHPASHNLAGAGAAAKEGAKPVSSIADVKRALPSQNIKYEKAEKETKKERKLRPPPRGSTSQEYSICVRWVNFFSSLKLSLFAIVALRGKIGFLQSLILPVLLIRNNVFYNT